MPVTREHRPWVGSELQQTALMSAHVPQLHIPVLGHRRERVRLVGAELHVADGLSVAVQEEIISKSTQVVLNTPTDTL